MRGQLNELATQFLFTPLQRLRVVVETRAITTYRDRKTASPCADYDLLECQALRSTSE